MAGAHRQGDVLKKARMHTCSECSGLHGSIGGSMGVARSPVLYLHITYYTHYNTPKQQPAQWLER